jgi:hypothetical protein
MKTDFFIRKFVFDCSPKFEGISPQKQKKLPTRLFFLLLDFVSKPQIELMVGSCQF